MNVGVSSACFYPDITTENTVKVCKELGFNLMEIFLESPYEYKYMYNEELRDICLKNEMKIYSVHAFSGSFEPHLFDAYKRRRDDMLNIFCDVLNAGALLGAKCYVFHGLRRTVQNDKIDYQNIAKSMDFLADMAGERGLFLAWENVSWCESSDPEFIKGVIEYTNTRNLRFTLDLKQARKSGHTAEEYIDVMGDKLVNVHINDSNDDNMCLLPGEGTADLGGIMTGLEEKGYNGPFIIEVYRDNYNDLNEIGRAREYLCSLPANKGHAI